MNYTRSIPFSGDLGRAFACATTILTNNGFAIADRRETMLEFVGPGMHSSRQNPLVGATEVRIRADGGHLELEAVLGGVDAMRRFLTMLPAGLATLFVILLGPVLGGILGQVFHVGFGVPFARGWQWLALAIPVAVIPVAPWLFLSPIMARSIRSRTTAALDTLLTNMEAMGRS